MSQKLDPHVALLIAAGRFCARPAPATQAELAAIVPPARDVYEILPALYQQLIVACERVAEAPPVNWPLAVEGMAELIATIGAPTPAELTPPAPASYLPLRTAPIICPQCGEPSASPFVCDVCGETIAQNGEAA